MAAMMRRANGTGAGGAARGVALAAALLAAAPLLAADVAVTWTRRLGGEESGYTRLHVYLTNRGKDAARITGAHVNGQYLDFMAAGMPMFGNVPDLDAMAAPVGGGAEASRPRSAEVPPGGVEWRRAAFNPIPAGVTGEVTILLRGAVKQADVRVEFQDRSSVAARITDAPAPLRLSCVAFDPAAPGKTYIYCENNSKGTVEVDHVVVNGAAIKEFRSIPVGASIEPGTKSCLIAQMTPAAPWGSYIDVGVVGRGGECVWAVLRVMSHFPICEWKGDTRPEMFLDSIPGFLQKPDERVEESPDRYTLRPWRVETDVQARNGGRWRATAEKIITDIENVRSRRPNLPSQINLANPVDAPSAAYFGGLTDVMLINLYRIRHGSATENASRLSACRAWVAPGHVTAIQEAFALPSAWPHPWHRSLTPNEIRFSMWSVIGEGSKGVCLYVRDAVSPNVGYDAMPGARWVLARTNAELQILRSFLRCADTLPGAAQSDGTDVECRALLCGDKGMLVVLLAHPGETAVTQAAALTWSRRTERRVRVRTPSGVRVVSVNMVNCGLRPMFAAHDGRSLNLLVEKIDEVAVVWLRFGDRDVVSPIAPVSAQLAAATEANAVTGECWAWYAEAMNSVCAPLRNDKPMAVGEIMERGRQAAAMHAAVLAQLSVATPDTGGSGQMKAGAYCCPGGPFDLMLRLGSSPRDHTRWRTEMPTDDAEALTFLNAMADRCMEQGLPREAVAVLVDGAPRLRRRDLRIRLTERICTTLCVTLRDPKAAVPWANTMLRDGSGTANEPAIRVFLASVLLHAGSPDAAAALLEPMLTPAPSAELDYFLGYAYLKVNRLNDALVHLQRCVDASGPWAGQASYLVGMIRVSRQEYDEAQKAFGRATACAQQQQLFSVVAGRLEDVLARRVEMKEGAGAERR